MTEVFLNNLGIVNALGTGCTEVLHSLASVSARYGDPQPGVSEVPWGLSPVFSVGTELPDIDQPEFDNRVNRLLAAAADQITDSISRAIDRWGADRIGVVLGSTDNGSAIAYESIRIHDETGDFPEGFSLEWQNANNPSEYLKNRLGLRGPESAVSTACSSSAVALIQARELIRGGICDAVICGGADIVSRAVYMGFGALEAVAPGVCNPFSSERAGITLGEGAALFLMSRDGSDWSGAEGSAPRLLGSGESSDAFHMTAPHPEGQGAEAAMKAALSDAGLQPREIDYLNLHGTGTELNDSMESKAVSRIFGDHLPLCSSTKGLTGHTLGAAGATEAGLCWLSIRSRIGRGIPPVHRWDGQYDGNLPRLDFRTGESETPVRIAMSNSFAFGGNNVSLILGVDE